MNSNQALNDINQNQNVNNMSVLSVDEQNKLLYDFNATESGYPKEKTIFELFEDQVVKTPYNVAIDFHNHILTYKKLNEKANQLARVLRHNGVGRETIVALIMNNSLELSIGILGILKAGGAYLPISPDI